MQVLLVLAANDFEIEPLKLPGNRSDVYIPHLAVVHLDYWGNMSGGAGEETLICTINLTPVNVPLDGLDT